MFFYAFETFMKKISFLILLVLFLASIVFWKTLNHSTVHQGNPLALDLGGDGLKFVNLADSKAKFDLKGNHFATQTAWLKGDDGFLVLDKNKDGIINDINELFGNTVQGGFCELKDFDSNHDEKIDIYDSIFPSLKIWQDNNGDGISQTYELKSLSDLNLVSVGLNAAKTNKPATSDAKIIKSGLFTRTDGTSGQISEILLTIDPTHTVYVGKVEITDEIVALPNIKGYGQMADLHIAMALDPELKEIVKNGVANLNGENFVATFEAILYRWAKATDISLKEIDPNPTLPENQGAVTFNNAGVTLTLQQLGVIKAYSGLDILALGDGHWGPDIATQTTGALYKQSWDTLYRNLLVKFAVVTGYLKDVLSGVSYSPTTDLVSIKKKFIKDADSLDYLALLHLINANDSNMIAKGLLIALLSHEFNPSAKQSFKSLFNDFIDYGFAEDFIPSYNNPLFRELDIAEFGSDDADSMQGTPENDIFLGLAGNDTLKGKKGNDFLSGGIGDDKLYGDEGNDTFDGSLGNDYLEGGIGNDKYLFGLGSGQDTIYDYDTNDDNADVVVFGGTLTPEDIDWRKSGENLKLVIKNTKDVLLIQKWFDLKGFGSKYRIERFRFADGTEWTEPDIEAVISSTYAERQHNTDNRIY